MDALCSDYGIVGFAVACLVAGMAFEHQIAKRDRAALIARHDAELAALKQAGDAAASGRHAHGG